MSLAAEGLVAVLLVITIGYCMVLNSRLKRLRADESDLRATISELVSATEIAERAIGGLKEAALDCDKTLSTRMREAEHFSMGIAQEIAEGQKVLSRIKQIAGAVRKSEAPARIASQDRKPAETVTVPAATDTESAVATVQIGKADIRTSMKRLEEAVTAKQEDAGKPVVDEANLVQAMAADVKPVPAPSRAANRIEELRVMADQARERLKELRKVNTEKAA
jgi:hypothetical protein